MYIVIAGITSLSKKLADDLEQDHDVVIVEDDQSKSERLYAQTGVEIINGNPASLSALEDAEVQKADVVVSTLDDDNKNVVVASLAKKFNVDKVISRVNDTDYLEAFEVIGAETVEHSSVLFSEFRSKIKHPYLVRAAALQGNLDMLKARVVEGSDLSGSSLTAVTDESDFPEEFAPSAILRNGDFYTDNLGFRLEEGDIVLFIGPRNRKSDLNAFLRRRS